MFGNSPLISTGLRSTLTLPKVLNGISKTLGIVNQAIPLYNQAKPMIQKGKTLFKLATAINSSDPKEKEVLKKKISKTTSVKTATISKINKPVFFQ